MALTKQQLAGRLGIIGFGHVNRTGKSTCAEFAKEILEQDVKTRVHIVPLAHSLKMVACMMYGWAGVKNPRY